MRTREDIEGELTMRDGGMSMKLSVEVEILLDIRDLLQQLLEEKWFDPTNAPDNLGLY